LVTAINDWRKERQFRGLQNKIEEDHQASVIRDNRIQQIPITDLVVGDLCFIKYGKNQYIEKKDLIRKFF
jgi:Ca2+ transporting ATPase